jgi:hypothetical protein
MQQADCLAMCNQLVYMLLHMECELEALVARKWCDTSSLFLSASFIVLGPHDVCWINDSV